MVTGSVCDIFIVGCSNSSGNSILITGLSNEL